MGNLALLPSYLGREQRLLKEDAAAGGVHEGDTDGERTVRLQAMNAGHSSTVGDKHLSQSAAQLADHSGWLCWPTRWRDIAGTNKEHTVSAAFVSDSGHVVWGGRHRRRITGTFCATVPLPVGDRSRGRRPLRRTVPAGRRTARNRSAAGRGLGGAGDLRGDDAGLGARGPRTVDRTHDVRPVPPVSPRVRPTAGKATLASAMMRPWHSHRRNPRNPRTPRSPRTE